MARIYGTQGDDELIGTEGFDKIAGRGGNDVLIGYGHEHGDWIFGGAGNDQLSGSIASDRLHGDAGNDWIFGDSDRGDLTYFDGADDRIWGGAGDDYLDGMNGDDVIAAGPGNDWVQDAIGDHNHILLGPGDDVGRGTGRIEGNDGNDRLQGSAWAASTLVGGRGADTFTLDLDHVDPMFAHTTRVADFNPAQGDRLLIHATDGQQLGGGYLYDVRGQDVFKSFDLDGDGHLGSGGDPYAHLVDAGHGRLELELDFWATKALIPVNMATPEHWDSSPSDFGQI
jgi:Ca2+-binding RTX toxin-like protein